MVCWVAEQMGAAFQPELLALKVVIAPVSYALTALGTLATMLLAARQPPEPGRGHQGADLIQRAVSRN